MRSDMDDFITKPIERRQLLAAVERSLDSRLVILVADDSAPDRDRAMHYLRGFGPCFGDRGGHSGTEAVAACARQRVSFALINISLPDISGVEARTRIRSVSYGAGYIGIVAGP